MSDKRTIQQNRSLHKFCELLAIALNDAGLDMKKTLKEEIEIPWTKESVKEHLWKPIQVVMVDKESTTEMDTVEPSIIYETLNRHLSQKFGISVDWPSLR